MGSSIRLSQDWAELDAHEVLNHILDIEVNTMEKNTTGLNVEFIKELAGMDSRKVKKKKIDRDVIDAYLFILPNMLGFLAFAVIPVVVAFGMSLMNWQGTTENLKFIGLRNYIRLFEDENFWIAVKNTFIFVLGAVPGMLLVSLLIAMLLNRKMKGVNFYRSLFFMPYNTAMVAVALVFSALMHPTMGPINSFLASIGISDPPQWLVDRKWAMFVVILVTIFKEFGYYMVIFLAGLQGIPKELYEASTVDGANGWKKFRNVTIPMLSPVTFLCVILAIIQCWKVFDQVYIMTEGGPGNATTTLVQFIYTTSFRFFDLSYGASAAFMLLILLVVITVIQYKGQKKWVNY